MLAAPAIRKAIVDLRYPADSGLQAKLEALGYEIAWAREPRVARLVEMEGWEQAIEPDAAGGYTSYRVKDRPAQRGKDFLARLDRYHRSMKERAVSEEE